jgi:ribose/xylose/arabinose/galactoside ABC-type transport system permease subunit
VFQLFRVLSFQATELATPPVIGGLGDVWLPQHGSSITALGENPASFLDFANYLLWGVPFSFLFVIVIVFLPTVVGCKTTLIIYGPKKWGHARGIVCNE